MSLEPIAYLDDVLDHLQQHSINRDQVDWAALRADAQALAVGARTTADTYPAIGLALDRLGDRHSFFLRPEQARQFQQGRGDSTGLVAVFPEGVVVLVLPGSPAARSGLREGDIIERINGEVAATLDLEAARAAFSASPVALLVRRAGAEPPLAVTLHAAACSLTTMPRGRRLRGDVGYLEVPAMIGSADQVAAYAATAQRLIRAFDQRDLAGWVVDLRRNGGGNMGPMLAGVGPLVGDGPLGAFVAPDWRAVWSYRAGQALVGQHLLAQVEEPYELRRPAPPVAVLTSRLTRSSGELTLLAFKGRPRTRTFGEATAGTPTSNDSRVLQDGAMLFVTTARGADATGRTYDDPIVPDQPVSVDWTRLGRRGDPVLHAAREWLLKVPWQP